MEPTRKPSFFEKIVNPDHSETPYPIWLVGILLFGIAVGLILLLGPIFLGAYQASTQKPTTPTPTLAYETTETSTKTDNSVYTLTTIPISFEAPSVLSSFGQLYEIVVPSTKGSRLCGGYYAAILGGSKPTDCTTETEIPLVFGTTSSDYPEGNSTFLDAQGFVVLNNKYFIRLPGNKTQEIPSSLVKKIANENGNQVIMITGSDDYAVTTPGDGWIGAIINTNDLKYTGLALKVEKNLLSSYNASLENVLSTVKVGK